ncbi:MlaE family ABC transporter permease [Nocardioides jiangxiensis]|uniref:ABC transporter permease n=1 Tax=Nocardioides jiangxiensis TaxID=3064524 RepID=A0ABT9AZ32_9ACTN|nr:ABC transporter permease [Nocardioides sp. WY-20]MDO7867254.1 ABC transporter permease [Nocardioides sp. WY-20]
MSGRQADRGGAATTMRRAAAASTASTRSALADLGRFSTFAGRALRAVPATLRKYPDEMLRQFTDIAWGSGAILVGGGTIGVMVLLSIAAGTSLGIEGFSGLEVVGLAPLTGFISAAVATREIAPLVAALALAAQVGCRFTAQIGSMRLHEEIDALEVMAVSSLRYLVTTRVIAAMLAIVPLYLVGLIGSYLAAEGTVVYVFGQSPGTYLHYFQGFIDGRDITFSVIKILIFAITVTLIHCWYGFNASGGPQGVGEATGRAIRASIVAVVLLDMFLTLLFWGTTPGFRISG